MKIDQELQAVFSKKAANNGWNSLESISGTGSELIQVRHLLDYLPSYLQKHKITTLLDAPCGDLNWMRYMLPDLDNLGIEYLGADIVPAIVSKLKSQYPTIQFFHLDVMTSNLPTVDCILMRDCLVHLPEDMIYKVLDNCKASGSKYLLTTSFISRTKNRNLKRPGLWRPLNLEIAPYNLVAEPEMVVEGCSEGDGKYTDKSLILIDLTKYNGKIQITE